jgi:hypothetical protein
VTKVGDEPSSRTSGEPIEAVAKKEENGSLMGDPGWKVKGSGWFVGNRGRTPLPGGHDRLPITFPETSWIHY